MRPSSLITRREVILAALVVLLLGLTGSSGQALPGAPAALPTAPDEPTVAPTSTPRSTPSPAPTSRPAPGPRVPVVNAAPRPVRVDARSFPARIESRDLDLDLPIRPVGVSEDGEMELPDTVAEVGWYRFGAHPGARTGTTVLAAHVDTRAEGLGPFVRLRDARKGDRVVVVDRAGRERTYRVADVRSTAKRAVDWSDVFARGGNPRLVLVTCGGAYDRDSGYTDNVLVTAFPLS